MYIVFGAQMTPHPLDAEVIGDLAALYKDIAPDPSELRCVKHRLELCGDKTARTLLVIFLADVPVL